MAESRSETAATQVKAMGDQLRWLLMDCGHNQAENGGRHSGHHGGNAHEAAVGVGGFCAADGPRGTANGREGQGNDDDGGWAAGVVSETGRQDQTLEPGRDGGVCDE